MNITIDQRTYHVDTEEELLQLLRVLTDYVPHALTAWKWRIA